MTDDAEKLIWLVFDACIKFLNEHKVDFSRTDTANGSNPSNSEWDGLYDAFFALLDSKEISKQDRLKAAHLARIQAIRGYLEDSSPISLEDMADFAWSLTTAFAYESKPFEDSEKQREIALKKYNDEKAFCIRKADELWTKNPNRYRMGEMALLLEKELQDEPELKNAKKNTIRGWLKNAEKEGKLSIPPGASQGGAPKTG